MLNIAQVSIPIGLEREFDYYFDPQKLKIQKGMRVLVNFNGKKRIGVVVNLKKSSKVEKLKPILDILDTTAVLTEKQISFADKLSHFYPYAKAEFIFMMLPSYLKKPKKHALDITCKDIPKIIRLKDNPPVREDLPTKTFIKADSFIERYAFWKEEIRKALEKGSVLICFPQLSYLERARKVIDNDFSSYIRVIQSRQKEKELYFNWNNSREKVLVLGTRVAMFYCPIDLELIIIEEDNSPYYYHEEKPFYHLRDVALLFSEIHKVNMILSADLPSLKTYKLIKEGKVVLKDHGSLTNSYIKLVNISEFSKAKLLSPIFIELLRKAIDEKKRVIIFWNKKGLGRAIICSNCGRTFTCKRCSASLQLILGSKEGICPYCQSKEQLPSVCHFCHNGYFKSVGYGIERLEANLRKIFPEVKIDNWQIYNDSSDIVLTTSKVLSYLPDLKKFDLGFCLDADFSLSYLDYNATFNLFIYLKKISLFIKSGIYVFTHNQNYYLFRYLNQNWIDFYEAELTLRQSLNLPPFSFIIKITLRAVNKNMLLKKSQQIYNKLKKVFSQVYGPSEERPFKLRDKYRYGIIVKTSDKKKAIKLIKKDLEGLRSSAVKLAINLE
ncbi:MAG: hypothetical protein KBB01_02985 [Candidatus Omnitrophica bacterium]|jgi:primosomal protein N' (replication factor Y)|nr:hypothetical protein [Candidatus Omnitrophota bacterium]